MIEQRKRRGWTFVYIGANQDAWQSGTSLGIPGGNTYTYDPLITSGTFRSLGVATSGYLSRSATYTENFTKGMNDGVSTGNK